MGNLSFGVPLDLHPNPDGEGASSETDPGRDSQLPERAALSLLLCY